MRCLLSLYENQIHKYIINTSSRRHSIRVNKNSSIGLEKCIQTGTVTINDVLHAQQSSDILEGHQCWLCCVPADISLLRKFKVVRPII